MKLQIAVCDTANDVVAARAYWVGKGYAEIVGAGPGGVHYDPIGAEEWSGWVVDPATNAVTAGLHGPLPTSTGPGFVLLFKK